VKLRGEDPVDAIPLFEQASQGTVLSGDLLADRGLAYDLVGDNASAQRYYREALANGANDETVRRLALSQAIAGDRKSMETTLAPLLQKQDRAAWRTRAFAFAILGREDEAEAIARSTMPTELANGMAPYLRFMRKLTPAQQAAAANLGRFPMPRRSARTIRASPLTPRSMAFAIWPLPMRRWRLPERRSVPRRARQRPRRPGWPLPTSRAAGRVGRRWMPRRRCLLPPPIPAARAQSLARGLAAACVRWNDARAPSCRSRIGGSSLGARDSGRASADFRHACRRARNHARAHDHSGNAGAGAGRDREAASGRQQLRSGPFAARRKHGARQARPGAARAGCDRAAAAAGHLCRGSARAGCARPSGAKVAAKSTRKASFAEAFSEWGDPSGRKVNSEAPASGAVDIRKIKAPRPAPKPPKEPPAPNIPAASGCRWAWAAISRASPMTGAR
jgi:hypothetical protein